EARLTTLVAAAGLRAVAGVAVVAAGVRVLVDAAVAVVVEAVAELAAAAALADVHDGLGADLLRVDRDAGRGVREVLVGAGRSGVTADLDRDRGAGRKLLGTDAERARRHDRRGDARVVRGR